jgi:hypothetical protein
VFCFGSITVPFIRCLKIPKQQDEKEKKEKEMIEMRELFLSSCDQEKKERTMISLYETSNPSSPTTPPSYGDQLLHGSTSFEEKYIYPIVFSERKTAPSTNRSTSGSWSPRNGSNSQSKKNNVNWKNDSLQRGKICLFFRLS